MMRHVVYLLAFCSLQWHASADHALFPRQGTTAFSPSQTSACLSLASTCYPTLATCTATFCSSCAALGGPSFESCCSGPNAANCFATLLGDGTTQPGASATGASASATITNDPNAEACNAVYSIEGSCASATPGFTTLQDIEIASCLCYTASGSQTVFAPDYFDGLASSCASFALTADTTAYSLFEAVAGLCTSLGNVRGASGGNSVASASATTTTGVALSTRTVVPTTTANTGGSTQTIITSSSSALAATHGGMSEISERLAYLLFGVGWLM